MPKESKTTEAKEAVLDFTADTTLHGASLIVNATSFPMKVFWAAIFVASVCGFFVHLMILVQRYVFHPVNYETTYVVDHIPFPDITICNTIGLSLGKIIYNRTGFDANGAFNESIDYFKNVKSIDGVSDQIRYDIHRRIENMLYVTMSDDFSHGEYMIAQCLFQGDLCDRSKFKEVKIPGYGNCYTLPSPGMVENPQESSGYEMVLFTEGKVTRPGGRSVIWDSNFTDRFGILSKFEYNAPKPSGMKIVVHAKDSYPDPAKGVVISSGAFWNMALEPKWTSRDPKTVTGCEEQLESKIHYHDYIKKRHLNYSYTLGDCRKTLLQNKWHENCGCLSEDLPVPANITSRHPKGGKHVQDILLAYSKHSNRSTLLFDNFCFFSLEHMKNFREWKAKPAPEEVEKNMKCATENLLHFEDHESEDKCKAPCEEIEYRVSLSNGKFGRDMPATRDFLHSKFYCPLPKAYEGKFKDTPIFNTLRDLCNELNGGDNTQLSILRENFLQLNIYFQSGAIKHIVEIPAYPLTNLFSDLGGIMGLYVGVSIITVCELAQLGIQLLAIMGCKGDKKQTKLSRRRTCRPTCDTASNSC